MASSLTNFKIGDIDFNSRCFELIAEIGINHNGSVQLAKEMLSAIAETGVRLVKFQVYSTDRFYHPKLEKIAKIRNLFRSCELSFDDYLNLVDYGKSLGIFVFATPLSDDWIYFISQNSPVAVKVASADADCTWLLKKVAGKTPLLLSTGATQIDSLKKTVSLLNKIQIAPLALLHCVSIYPTLPQKLNLARITELKSKFTLLTGFSDHTIGCEAIFQAALAGADFFEKHFTLDKTMPGPDQALSADQVDFQKILNHLKTAQEILGTGGNSSPEEFDPMAKRHFFTPEGEFEQIMVRPRI